LAEKAGVTAGTISHIERGLSKPRRFETVRKLSAALQVEPQYIDEFQHLVGAPESLLDSPAAASRLEETKRRLDAFDDSKAVLFEDVLNRVEQDRARVAA